MQWGQVGTKSHLTLAVEFLGSEKKFTWVQILFSDTFLFNGGVGQLIYLTSLRPREKL